MKTKNVMYALDWEILLHADYSLDLVSPSDYHLFRLLQNHLADTHFKTGEEIRKSQNDFIQDLYKDLYKDDSKSSKW